MEMNGTIIILAAIAAFLGFRLYTLLGKRTGHEQEPMMPRNEARPESRTVPPILRPNIEEELQSPNSGYIPTELLFEPRAERGIRDILTADRDFSVGRFIDGAKSAYRMILEAYWSGDRDTLRSLTDDDTYAAFVEAIEDREARGEKLDNRLVAIDHVIISDAELYRGLARITVRLDADIAAVTRDAEGKVLAGSLTDAVETHDVWTFSRNLSSRDPNWKLDETDEA